MRGRYREDPPIPCIGVLVPLRNLIHDVYILKFEKILDTMDALAVNEGRLSHDFILLDVNAASSLRNFRNIFVDKWNGFFA